MPDFFLTFPTGRIRELLRSEREGIGERIGIVRHILLLLLAGVAVG